MNAFRLRDGTPWMIREDAYRAYCRAALQPLAGMVPGQTPAQPPPWPDPAKAGPGYDLVGGVAVVPVYGPLYRHAGFLGDLMAFAFGGVSYDRLADALRSALADPAAKAVLLTIDSPGGMVAGLGELAGVVREAGSVKPVAAYCEANCCSAAYYLAAACGEITAAPSALVGSIGTVIVAVDDSGFQDAIGIKEIPVVSSQSPDKWPDVTTPAGLAVYQKIVDDLASVFISDVARYRGVPAATVLSDFGRGGVMLGADARRAGMVDKVGTLDDVLSKLSGPNRHRLAVKRPAAHNPVTTSAAGPPRLRLKPQGLGRA